MDPVSLRPQRTEQIIALTRTVLAGFVLLAVWLEPDAPVRHPMPIYALLAAYSGYALALAAFAGLRPPGNRFASVTHAVDLGFFALLTFIAEGTTGPLFVFFVFALMAGALRWGQRGVLWTVVPALTIFVGLGVYEMAWMNPLFEAHRFAVRIGHLGMVAVLLVYLAGHQERLRGELARLAAWPRPPPGESPLPVALRHAAGLVDAQRALLCWQDDGGPQRYAWLIPGGEVVAAADAVCGPALVHAQLAEADFLCRDLRAAAPRVLYTAAEGLRQAEFAPLPVALVEHHGLGSVLGLRLEGMLVRGRVLLFDAPRLDADDLLLGRVLARQLTLDLDQHCYHLGLQEAVVAEERTRFARELHDGLLQSLTGIRLRLQAAGQTLDSDRRAAAERLAELEELLAAEQRDLRFLIEQLQAQQPEGGAGAALRARLMELAERAEHIWGLRVDLQVAPLPAEPPDAVARALAPLLQEALANAARHGGAQQVRVILGATGERLRCIVVDDGRGFAFRGRRDLAALAREGLGPKSLRQRIAALGGELVVHSTELGARLEIDLPLAPRGR